jgi:glucokinase
VTYVGLDVGGTNLKGARVSADGGVLARIHEPTVRDSADRLLDQLARAVARLSDGGSPSAVGVGVPAIVDQRTRRVRAVPNLPSLAALADRDLAGVLSERLGTPVVIENDARAAGLAEAWKGGGRGVQNLLFLTLGTGVGSAFVLDGRLWTGKSGFAGEVGHMPIAPDGERCGCGSRGCLETIVGSFGWMRRAEIAVHRHPGSVLARRTLEPATIVDAARAGDAVALEVVDETARALGQAIAGLLNALNLERVVIGGGVAAAGEFLLERIVRETRARAWPQVFADCSFRLAELGGEAGVVGAARVAMLASATGSAERPPGLPGGGTPPGGGK